MKTTMAAPNIGPVNVPNPPSSVIRITSPDTCHDTSVRVAN